MRPHRSRLAAATLVAVATLTAACSDGSSASTSRPADATRSKGTGAVAPTTGNRPGTSSVPATTGEATSGPSDGSGGDTDSAHDGTPGSTGAAGAGTPGTESPSPAAAQDGSSGNSAAPPDRTTTTAAGTTTSGSGTLPVITATTDGGFVSPDRDVACLIDIDPSDQVRCASFSPAAVVVMTPDGALTRCSGSSCALGSRNPGYKVLATGTATGTNAFRCASTTAGITCTVPSGTGFTISPTGVRTVG